MKNLAWVLLGWTGVVFWSSVGTRIGWYHLMPDAAVMTVVFLALRREPLLVTLTALTLGYLVGRAAVAPIGLHETALVGCAIGVYLASGALTGSGAWFFGIVCGGATMAYHLALYGLLWGARGEPAFSGLATAMLVPSGLVTALLGVVSYPVLNALDRRLTADRHEALSWR